MSLFITNLAFVDPELIKVAKISIMLASLIAAVGGVAMLLTGTARDTREGADN